MVRPINDAEKYFVEDQKLFRYRISMLFLVKHSRPTIANVTQELLSVMDDAKHAPFLERQQVIMYSIPEVFD